MDIHGMAKQILALLDILSNLKGKACTVTVMGKDFHFGLDNSTRFIRDCVKRRLERSASDFDVDGAIAAAVRHRSILKDEFLRVRLQVRNMLKQYMELKKQTLDELVSMLSSLPL